MNLHDLASAVEGMHREAIRIGKDPKEIDVKASHPTGSIPVDNISLWPSYNAVVFDPDYS